MSLKSMTGIGTSSFEAGDIRYECSIRSVNRRYLDLTIRLPPELAALEPLLRRPVQSACGRGDVVLCIDRTGSAAGKDIRVDEEAARALHAAYLRVAEAVGSSEEVPLSALLSSSDVVKAVNAAPTPEIEEAVTGGVMEALADLDGSRSREGAAVERDIVARLASVGASWKSVRGLLPQVRDVLLKRAASRVKEVTEAAGVDADERALANALTSIAEKADVSEEVSRMEAHLSEFASLVEDEPPHGRKLDFLVQEMMREVGTTAAKCQHAAVSHVIVEAKAELERIREQLANVL